MADGTQIELPGAAYFKVVARFGRWTSDGGDPDEFPDRVTTGGTVKLSIDTTDQLVRVREADGGWRLEEVAEREYIVSASGELLNPQSGNVGVWLIDTSNPAIDPQHATYQATITTPSGKTRTLHFNQESAAGGVVDLVGAVSMDPVFGEAQLDGRVTALESRVALIEGGAAGLPPGADGEVLTWDAAAGAYLPKPPPGGGAVSSVNTKTGAVTLDAADVGAAAEDHNHDDRYYTEAEVDQLLSGVSGGGGVSDHGALTGLTDDDHQIYALADGTRGDFAPTSHGHVLADITDYTAPDLSGLVADDDPRLSDARTPTAHDHTVADVTGLQDALDGKQAAGSYAPASGQAPVNALTPAGTVTVPATHSMHTLTMTGDTTLTFSNPTAGHVFALKLSGAYVPTFPASVTWAGGTAPTYASGSVYTFASFDAGTSWTGAKL